ncbi:MAG: PAS domain S-box protein [candidate division KSB1 bacterium]|nr:PAS domain S-box protein [candidate division KSB1 bacterium]
MAKVLVVEDENIVAMDIQNTLKKLGYVVTAIASSGEEAIQKAAETQPELVLMDIVLKGSMDGVAAAEQIRARFNIPVIYLTAYADEDTLQRAKITEPFGYILKPFNDRELHTAIEMARYKHNLEKKLTENQRWLATTLKSIGDAVITTDTGGYITFMNPVAEALTGWKQDEATGSPLNEVFHIISEETGEPVRNPVARVLQEGVIVGLGNHTILIAKDGRKIPIDDSAAPIKDDRGNITGVVLVFHDITERRQAEEALRETNARLNTLIEAIPDVIYFKDAQGRNLTVNKAFEQLTGLEKPQILGKTDAQLFPPELAQQCRRSDEEVIKRRQPIRAVEHTTNDKGEPVYFETIKCPLLDDQGNIRGLVGVSRDITERKRAEKALLATNQRLQILQQVTTSVHGSLEPQEVFQQITDALVDLMGFTTAVIVTLDEAQQRYQVRSFASSKQFLTGINKILGFPLQNFAFPADQVSEELRELAVLGEVAVRKHLAELIHPPLDKLSCQALEKLGGSKSFILAPLVKAGKLIGGIIISSAQEQVPQDELNMLRVFAHAASQAIINADLHHRTRQAEAALRESEKRYRALVEDMPALICRFLPDGRLTFVNNAYCRYFKKDSKELLGKNFFQFIPDEDREAIKNHYQSLTQERPIVTYEHKIVLPNEGIRWQQWTDRALFDEKGHLVQYQSIGYDITERKQAEEEKAKLEERLRQSQKMEAVGRLAGGVAHDFNNLLTAISGYTELLLGDLGPGHPMRADLGEIKKAADRAAALTRQLLAFSRRQLLQPKVLDLNTLITNMDNMLRRLIGEDIELVTRLEPKLRRVKADPGQIEQVIMNLVVNAHDAMPQGGKLTIQTENRTLKQEHCQLMPEARPGQFVCLSLTDTGLGMDQATISQLFEPFFTTKGPGEGSGLGLSVVYGIVKQHDGWITVDSQPGQGSTFKVYLPAFSLALEVQEQPPKTVSIPELQGQGQRILLVEDEETVREFTSRALAENGYLVVTTTTAQEALERFEQEKGKFHLVFSDVVLPDQNGLQLVEHLLTRKPELRVLLCSGYTDQKSQWPLIQEKGFRFLQKPYVLSDLLQAVRETLQVS